MPVRNLDTYLQERGLIHEAPITALRDTRIAKRRESSTSSSNDHLSQSSSNDLYVGTDISSLSFFGKAMDEVVPLGWSSDPLYGVISPFPLGRFGDLTRWPTSNSKLIALPEALKDTDSAIEADPNFTKTYIRRL
ncbi:hypothetical protein PPACK8108_LOCUS23911 [Phakopsora pachyrhizi]|uniref:Uncharacterized protein n=1 Tax=Phakopsora pachyrhizi TaxID=170000 RepID=A0AAV0BRQ3_PHAPC|nr:hypothetical protein PPACK8108_LOCUS23911 [Phakopsora pachyrhizi]